MVYNERPLALILFYHRGISLKGAIILKTDERESDYEKTGFIGGGSCHP